MVGGPFKEILKGAPRLLVTALKEQRVCQARSSVGGVLGRGPGVKKPPVLVGGQIEPPLPEQAMREVEPLGDLSLHLRSRGRPGVLSRCWSNQRSEQDPHEHRLRCANWQDASCQRESGTFEQRRHNERHQTTPSLNDLIQHPTFSISYLRSGMLRESARFLQPSSRGRPRTKR